MTGALLMGDFLNFVVNCNVLIYSVSVHLCVNSMFGMFLIYCRCLKTYMH